jgi:NADH-quinone oxidoreductase subunit B
MHVPGCPPRPEALVYGILKLRAMVLSKPDQGWRSRYGGRGTEEFVESQLAADAASQHADNVTGASGRMGPSA